MLTELLKLVYMNNIKSIHNLGSYYEDINEIVTAFLILTTWLTI